jgi:hypothetical protein
MKETVTVPGYMGKPWTVTGDVESGLMVHKMGKEWIVTHVASGMKIGAYVRTAKEVKARRAALLAILPDWTEKDLCGLALAAGEPDTAAFGRKVREVAY